jgi:hypothetical protein
VALAALGRTHESHVLRERGRADPERQCSDADEAMDLTLYDDREAP